MWYVGVGWLHILLLGYYIFEQKNQILAVWNKYSLKLWKAKTISIKLQIHVMNERKCIIMINAILKIEDLLEREIKWDWE